MSESINEHSAPEDAGAMGPDKLRRRIAEEAARLMQKGGDSQRARFRAARRVAHDWVPDQQIPSHEEVRREIGRTTAADGGLSALMGDRFDQIAAIVGTLASVRQDPVRHPEGDALEHSLQVFDLVHEECGYDEELLTAALVHDVGKSIDRRNHLAAGIEALGELITPRTRWLVESLEAATAHADGTLGHRARQRLEAHPDRDAALLLATADRRGRVRGYDAPSLDEAIGILRSLAAESDGAGEECGG